MAKKSNTKVIGLVLFFLFIVNPILQVSAQDYVVSYTSDQVGMQVELTMSPGDIKEFNVSITADNTSMTVIIKTLDNSGPLWGFFLENSSFYPTVRGNLDSLLNCCPKYADHASFYSVVFILSNPGSYVLAFYDTLGHPAPNTHFIATFLKGIHGTEEKILPPEALTDLYLTMLTGGLSLIAIVLVIAIIKKRFV